MGLPEVTPVYDSIQLVVSDMLPEEPPKFQKAVKEIGKMKLAAFGLEENARNWRTWRFIDGIDDIALPKTNSAIDYTFDIRLHFDMSDDKIDAMADVIHRSLESIRQPADGQEPEGKLRSNETPSLEQDANSLAAAGA